jgi:anti-anti-sigma factor
MNILIGQETGKVPVTILQISGDLDASTHKEFQDKASELINDGSENILLDLSGVSFLGSAGLRVIHALTKMLTKAQDDSIRSKHVKLLNPSEGVSKVIKTLGFDDYLDIYTDKDAAVTSFS